MKVFLENKKLDAAKTIYLDRPMSFAGMVKAVRQIEPCRDWQIVESLVV